MDRFLCKFFGLHHYEVLEKVEYHNLRKEVVGFVIVSRCSICGRIKRKTIYQEEHGR